MHIYKHIYKHVFTLPHIYKHIYKHVNIQTPQVSNASAV